MLRMWAFRFFGKPEWAEMRPGEWSGRHYRQKKRSSGRFRPLDPFFYSKDVSLMMSSVLARSTLNRPLRSHACANPFNHLTVSGVSCF